MQTTPQGPANSLRHYPEIFLPRTGTSIVSLDSMRETHYADMCADASLDAPELIASGGSRNIYCPGVSLELWSVVRRGAV